MLSVLSVLLLLAMSSPADAAPTVGSVALSPTSDCRAGVVEVGVVADVPVDREHVQASMASSSSLLTDIEQESGVGNAYRGPFTFPFRNPVAEGTMVGLSATFGPGPLDPATASEFFVLYECHPDGASVLVSSCSGSAGSCPRTVDEATAAATTTVLPPPAGTAPGTASTEPPVIDGTGALPAEVTTSPVTSPVAPPRISPAAIPVVAPSFTG